MNGFKSSVTQESCNPWCNPLVQIAGASLYAVDAQVFGVYRRSGISKCLVEVVRFEERVIPKKRVPVRVSGKQFEDPAHGNSHATDTRLRAAFSGFNRNSIEMLYHALGVIDDSDFRWPQRAAP